MTSASDNRRHIHTHKNKMQQHQQYDDRRRAKLINTTNKTKFDDFYRKLERIRLSAAISSSKQYPRRTATELLDESKRFFVKSQQVLYNRQTLSNNQRITPVFRTSQPRRSPYHESQHEEDSSRLDLSLQSHTYPTTNITDCPLESVSVLSLSDQTTLDSIDSPSHLKIVVPSLLTIIERNARVIKWLFQLHKTNASSCFQCTL